jgi:hypothetical protein
MTSDRYVDRTIEAWLDHMPSEAPDRAVAAVLQAVEKAPQVRQPLRPASWRLPRMNKFSLLSAAAVLTAVAVGGALIAGGERETDPPPSSPPQPTVAPSTLEGPGGAGLVRGWFSGPRPGIVDAGDTANTYFRWVTGDSITLGTTEGASRRERFRSDVVVTTGGLEVRSVGTSNGCAPDQAGSYETSISPGGTALDIALIEDECEARAGALIGRWYNATCPTAQSPCLGELEAVTYPSGQFATTTNDQQPPSFGALTYTGREGWTNTNDFVNGYWLEPTDWHRAYLEQHGGRDPGDRPETKGVYVFSGITGSGWDPTCSADPDPAAGTTASELVEWIQGQPSLDVSTPEPAQLPGGTGFSIDVRLAPSWTGTCPYANGEPIAPLLVGAPGTRIDWGVAKGFAERFIVLDVGADQPVLIDISAPEDEFDAFLPEAMRLVETFEFHNQTREGTDQ